MCDAPLWAAMHSLSHGVCCAAPLGPTLACLWRCRVEEEVVEVVVAVGTLGTGAEVGACPGLCKREQVQGGLL